MGCHVFSFVHHVSCYDICFVLLPFSKLKFVGAYVHQYFFAWLLYSNLLHLIRRYTSTYEEQITDKRMKEFPGDSQSAGGWEYWIKLENHENVFTGRVSEDLHLQLTPQDYIKKVSGSFNTLINQKYIYSL